MNEIKPVVLLFGDVNDYLANAVREAGMEPFTPADEQFDARSCEAVLLGSKHREDPRAKVAAEVARGWCRPVHYGVENFQAWAKDRRKSA